MIGRDPPQHDPSSLNAALPSKQSDLPARRMVDSYREGVIPITKDKQLWQKYVNFYRRIRFGRIMEDLDTMAGMKYTGGIVLLCLRFLLRKFYAVYFSTCRTVGIVV